MNHRKTCGRERSTGRIAGGWIAQIIVIAIALAFGSLAGAAADNGTIAGVVRDANGMPIPGAKVLAEGPAAGFRREAVTDSKGAYVFSNLPAGKYRITVELAGFQAARYSDVALAEAKTLQYDFRLNAGVSTEVAELGSQPQPGLVPAAAAKQATTAAEAPASAASIDCATCRVGGVIGGVPGGVSGGNIGGMVSGLPSPPPPPAPSPRALGGTVGGVLGGSFGGSLGGVPSMAPPPMVDPSRSGIATVVPAELARMARSVNGETVTNADNPFVPVSLTQLSTFSIDVDTASYANVRRFLTQNQRPPRDIVRIEELINYFSYDYPAGSGDDPITGNIEVAAAPWNSEHRLVRIGVRAKPVERSQKAANLVFLIDVSGSMAPAERLPLLKSSLRMLVERLTESDLVSIVTYAGAAGVALQPTPGNRKDTILQAIENLRAEGSTNGGAGIQTAYDLAVTNFASGGVNRVILATDGDFNVGVTDQSELVRLIESRAKSGVFLTVLGVGQNFKDTLLENLAHRGGVFAFLDTLKEAQKVLLEQIDATLVTVAKDVKIQVEFNPEHVFSYRLIGYENRLLNAPDFNDDARDAGDMGAGHTVTAFFEVVPRSVRDPGRSGAPRFESGAVDPLRYRQVNAPVSPISDELLNLKIRYKAPEGLASRLIDVPVVDRGATFANASPDFRFAAAVAAFGMILRDSPYKGSADWSMARSIALGSKGADRTGYREEFIQLVERAAAMWRLTLR